MAALGVAIGGCALADQLPGQPVSARGLSCRTEPQAHGRWLGSRSTCEVMAGIRAVELEMQRSHAAGPEVALRTDEDTVFHPDLDRDRVWWLPIGLLAGGVAWWAGLPAPADLGYGRHAAPRRRAAEPSTRPR